MATIKIDEVVGVYVDRPDGYRALLCMECWEGDFLQVSLDSILTQEQVDSSDKLYYCDECKKAI